MMSAKLDITTNREWVEHRNNRSEPPALDIFLTFLTIRADVLETLEEARSSKGKPDNSPVQKQRSFIVSAGNPPYFSPFGIEFRDKKPIF